MNHLPVSLSISSTSTTGARPLTTAQIWHYMALQPGTAMARAYIVRLPVFLSPSLSPQHQQPRITNHHPRLKPRQRQHARARWELLVLRCELGEYNSSSSQETEDIDFA